MIYINCKNPVPTIKWFQDKFKVLSVVTIIMTPTREIGNKLNCEESTCWYYTTTF